MTSSMQQINNFRRNPNFFVRQVLGHDPWELPEKILAALSVPNARVAVKACHSSGKCLAPNEPVLLSNGAYISAKDLVGRTFDVLIPGKSGFRSVSANASWNIVEQTVTLVTDSGRQITRSLNHPLYASQKLQDKVRMELLGWREIGSLHAGEYVAVPHTLEDIRFSEKATLSDDQLKFAAYNLGNIGRDYTGPLKEDAHLSATQEFIATAANMGCDSIAAPNEYIRAFQQEMNPTEPNTNVHKLIMDMGFHNFDADNMNIPPKIFIQPKLQQALFLSRLFAVGGYIDATSRYRISFRTTSKNLARDVKRMLLNFGICAILDDTHNFIWETRIDTLSDVYKFLHEIGIFGQEEECIEALRWILETRSIDSLTSENHVQLRFPSLQKGLYWERIKEIYLSGIALTVAIEVPEHHTFITDFWEHNTHTAAEATLWFTHTGGKTITTAPSWKQVEKLLWGEIHHTYDMVGHLLGGELLNAEYKITTNARAFGLSTDDGVNFQGHHDKGGGVLIIIDEAPGVSPAIFEAIEGIRAGGDVRILMLGNPVVSGNDFFTAFNKDRALWKTFTISAFDTPNLKGLTIDDLLKMDDYQLDQNIRPYLVTRRWVKEKFLQWGPTSAKYKARVLGEFPDQNEADLLSIAWIKGAMDRVLLPEPGEHIQAGIDVAGAGSDRTVLTLRQGAHMLEQRAWNDDDPREPVIAMLRWWERHTHMPLVIAVDSIGMGHYFIKHLEDEGFAIIPINASEAPKDDLIWMWGVDPAELPSRRFGNLKAQLYWSLREKFQEGKITGLKRAGEDLETELKIIRWREDERNGKIYIESKEQIKKRGFDSPDLAESLMLAYADVGVAIPTFGLVQASASGWGFGNGR